MKLSLAALHTGLGLAVLGSALLNTAAPASAIDPPVVESRFLYGDADGDGRITIHDASLALQQVVGLQKSSLRADVLPKNRDGTRGDGKVDLADVIGILRILVGRDSGQAARLVLSAAASSPVSSAAPLGDGSVRLQFTADDPDPVPVRLEFPSSRQVDFVVYQGEREVWRASRHESGDSSPSVLTIGGNSSHTFSGAWQGIDDEGQPLPPGQYQFRGVIPSGNGGILTSGLGPVTLGAGRDGTIDVSLSTDKAQYEPGEPVKISLTETNVGKTDARIYVGCPSYYDFWVTRNGQEVWRWSFGKLTCLAIGFSTLHPGESRTLSTVWNGEFNRSPAPANPLPMPPAGTYQVHGKVDEPDNGERIPTPVTVTFGKPVASDYFPLEVGLTWTYDRPGIGKSPDVLVKQTIVGTQTYPEGTDFVFDHFVNMDGVQFRVDSTGHVLQRMANGETVRYDLNGAEGAQWKYQPDAAATPWRATMVSRNAETDTNYGHLTHLLQIAFMTGVDTGETDYLAPGIGLVAVDQRVNVGSRRYLSLVSHGTQTGAKFDFPLELGDRWTYSSGKQVPPPMPPQPAGASPPTPTDPASGGDTVQQIVALTSGKPGPYSVFDQFETSARVALREDDQSIVWQQTAGGETERYELNAPMGTVWTYAPDPNGSAWRASVTARSVEMDTPNGHFTNVVKITFMGVDAGWIDYIAPGVGLIARDNYVAPRPVMPFLRLVTFARKK